MTQTLPMPTSASTERTILGAILQDNKSFFEANAILIPEDFSLDSHRRIYARVCDLMQKGEVVDIVTLADELGRHREIEAVGGVEYIAELTTGLPQRKSIDSWVKIVREKSQLRQLITRCTNYIARAQEESTEELLRDVHADIVNIIAASSRQNSGQYIAEFSDAYMAQVRKLREISGQIGLSSGISSVDRWTTGIRPEELWLLGARTGDGKTSVATQAAVDNARNKKTVGLFAIELSKEATLERMVIQNCKIEHASDRIRVPKSMSPEQHKAFEATTLEIAQLPIKIDDSGSLDIREFDAKARLMVQRDGVELIIIDHVHEMTSTRSKGGIRERFTDIAEGLRQFVKSTRVPVLGLAQLPKPDKSHLSRRPTKHDFRESGALEEKAHVCLLIHRELDDECLPTGKDEIIIGKQRNGPMKICPVSFIKRNLRYEERAL